MQPGLSLATQAWRFIVTGGLSAIVDFGLYIALLAAGLHVNVAKTISFIAGTTTAYLINRRWTFQAPPSTARFIAVCVLYAVTYAVQVGINYVFYMDVGRQAVACPGGVRHRTGHRNGHQLRGAARRHLPAALNSAGEISRSGLNCRARRRFMVLLVIDVGRRAQLLCELVADSNAIDCNAPTFHESMSLSSIITPTQDSACPVHQFFGSTVP